MRRLILGSIIFTLLLVSSGCNGNKNSINSIEQQTKETSIKNDVIESKIQTFQEEMKKYNPNLNAQQLSAICKTSNEKLYNILFDEKSITLDSTKIIGSESNFYLKITNDTTIKNAKYRMVEFGTKQAKMGGTINIYIQSWDSGKPEIHEVYSEVISQNIVKLIDYNIFSQGDNYFVLVDKLYGPESTYVRVFTKNYNGTEWLPYSGYGDLKLDGWNIEKNTILTINSSKVTFNNKNDYDIKLSNNSVEINVVDTNQKIIDSLELNFLKNSWNVDSGKQTTYETKWLKFSFEDFQNERKMVKEYRGQEIKDIEEGKMGADKVVKIGIALEDINGDGINEIIGLLSHRYYSSSNANAALGIYTQNNGKIEKYIPLPKVFVDTDNIGAQKEIGIIKSDKSNWVNFVINGAVKVWNGKDYTNAP